MKKIKKRKSFEPAVLAANKLGFRSDELAIVFGSAQLVEDVVKTGWLKPVVNRHKLIIFDRADILRAWSRILAGELPGPANHNNGTEGK